MDKSRRRPGRESRAGRRRSSARRAAEQSAPRTSCPPALRAPHRVRLLWRAESRSRRISGSANQLVAHGRADPGRGHRDSEGPRDHRQPGEPAPRLLLNRAFAAHDQPAGAHQHVGHRSAAGHGGGEQQLPAARPSRSRGRASSPAPSRRRTGRSQVALWPSRALTRKSKATPRRPISMKATGT